MSMGDAPVSRVLRIKGPQGLHARPAELFARTAIQFEATIELLRAEIRVDAKSVLQLLTLGADQGTELVLEARGVDARQAVEALVQLVDRAFVAENQHATRMFAQKLSDLKETDPEQRIKQDRQHRDHKERAAIAELIAHLAAKNQTDILPLHRFIRSRRSPRWLLRLVG